MRSLLNGVTDRTYLTGPRGPEYERLGAGMPTWNLYDGLGSVLGTVDASGNIVSTRKYDVYGSVRSLVGPSGTRHKFVGALGHPSDDESGLTYMRARYYDSATGRFESDDPSGDGPNGYSYARSSPTNLVDVSGRSAIGILQWCWTSGVCAGGDLLIVDAINQIDLKNYGKALAEINVAAWLYAGALLGPNNMPSWGAWVTWISGGIAVSVQGV